MVPSGPFTLRRPTVANTITDECVSCGACEPDCPNAAIAAGDMLYEIDPNLCDECAATGGNPACIDACPVDGAIVPA